MDKTTFTIGKYVVTVSSANRPSDDALRQAAQLIVDILDKHRIREASEQKASPTR